MAKAWVVQAASPKRTSQPRSRTFWKKATRFGYWVSYSAVRGWPAAARRAATRSTTTSTAGRATL